MNRRRALVLGFGLGGLVVLTLGIVFTVSVAQPFSIAHVASTSPTPSPVEGKPLPTPSMPPTVPPASPAGFAPPSGGAMAYDPENRGVLLFGGTRQAQSVAETWLWNGRSWNRLDVIGPPARSAEMMVYDSARHQVVLFGGSGPAGAGQALLFADTWTWDGTQWEEQHPAHVPNPRMRAAIAFDQKRGLVVMFGGEGEGTTTYNATWTWDGSDWTLQDPATAPPGRHFATMAYDEATGVTVLFGGSMAGARFNDTWTWDGSSWTEQSAPAPEARGWSDLAYDAATREVVAYVYFALDNNPVREYTIAWDGTHWIDRTTAGDPSPRAETRMAYDPDTREVVMVDPTSQTWAWDGHAWSLVAAAGGE